jgi:hypothetical protein
MTSDFGLIGKYIKDIAGVDGKSHSVLGYVTMVDEKKMVCEVVAADKSSTYRNVRLKEVTDKSKIENGFWLIPVVDSRVIIDCISPSEAYVSMVSEVSKVHYRVSDIRVGLSEEGFSIDRKGKTPADSYDFKTLMIKLIDTLEQFQVQTAWGPSGFPTGVAATELPKIKIGLEKILIEGDTNAA